MHDLEPWGRSRDAGIGGTDANRIAAGDWYSLWQEKRGIKAPDNLSRVFRVQLGKVTEDLHALFHHYETDDRIDNRYGNSPITRPGLDLPLFATVDRFVTDKEGKPFILLEMKHTNERESLRSMAERYMAQLHVQMLVTRTTEIRFSIIRGNTDPEWGIVAWDQDYWDKLSPQLAAFWECVTENIAPQELLASTKEKLGGVAGAAKAVPINGFKPYDWSTNNEWVDAAVTFIADKKAAENLKVSEPKIRGMIPADAETVSGGGLSFKRDARGAYRVKIDDAAE